MAFLQHGIVVLTTLRAPAGNLDADNDGLVTAGELGKWEPENDFVEILGICHQESWFCAGIIWYHLVSKVRINYDNSGRESVILIVIP